MHHHHRERVREPERGKATQGQIDAQSEEGRQCFREGKGDTERAWGEGKTDRVIERE